MVPSILAYVADTTTKETRAKGMGYLSAAMNLGIVLGPVIGGVIAQFGIRMPYCGAAAFILFGAILLAKEKKRLQKKDAAKNELFMESKSN